jgi:CheY-like chemotaxis protein
MTLLVVEDEPFLRKSVASSLRFADAQVTAVENGDWRSGLWRQGPEGRVTTCA